MIDPSSAASSFGSSGELAALETQVQAWLAASERESASSQPNQDGSGELPEFGLDGGFFVLNDRGTLAYTRTAKFHVAADGRLLDAHEREVMGYSSLDPDASPTALRVPERDLAMQRFSRYDLDERGNLFGIERKAPEAGIHARVPLGRFCIAIFPAPERLGVRRNGDAVASAKSGPPKFVPSDSVHIGLLRRHPAKPSLDSIRETLRLLWAASARAEIDVAVAASNDALSRIALNLVK